MEPIRWELPNLQMVLCLYSYFKVSHIPSNINTFTCSLNPILPSLYLDLAASIILLFSWVSSTSLSFSTGSIASAEIYTKLKNKTKTKNKNNPLWKPWECAPETSNQHPSYYVLKFIPAFAWRLCSPQAAPSLCQRDGRILTWVPFWESWNSSGG